MRILCHKKLKNIVGKRPIIELNIAQDGNLIKWANENVAIKVYIKYTPSIDELKEKDSIIAVYIDDNGRVTSIENSKYIPGQKVAFNIFHLSKLAIAFVKANYQDIKGYE